MLHACSENRNLTFTLVEEGVDLYALNDVCTLLACMLINSNFLKLGFSVAEGLHLDERILGLLDLNTKFKVFFTGKNS